MKKKIVVIVIGILLIGVKLYAAGDLIVNGKLGVGTSTPLGKIAIVGNNETRTLHVDNELNQSGVGNFVIGAEYKARLTGSANGEVYGFSANLNLENTADTAKALYAASVIAQIGRPDSPGTTTVNKIVGFDYILNRHYNNQRTYNVTDSYGFRTSVEEGSTYGASVNLSNHYHQYMKDPGALTKVSISNLAGLWIEKQTTGSIKNYGLVLDGDDAGADIVFGPTQSARIYSNTGRLYAQDTFGNQTILSPHDPETGEWIYYSKNIKTGKVVRVDMEKLVKAVENLTGETFMIETLLEDK